VERPGKGSRDKESNKLRRHAKASSAGSNSGPGTSPDSFKGSSLSLALIGALLASLLVAASASAAAPCANQAFRTGASATLPDCRAYEMVSPVDKNGGDVGRSPSDPTVESGHLPVQSSVSGEQLAYASFVAFGDAVASPLFGSQYIATRSAAGWSTHGVTPPRTLSVLSPGIGRDAGFKAFSPDLSSAWLLHDSDPLTPTAPPHFADLYRRDNLNDGYEALNPTSPPTAGTTQFMPELEGLSADGSHAIFAANDALTPDAPITFDDKRRLYDWSGGELHLVSILPDGTPTTSESHAGTHNTIDNRGIASSVDHAVSDDGTRVFWTASDFIGAPGNIYVRIDNERTVPVSGSVTDARSRFWTASADGSRAFFTVDEFVEHPLDDNLYEFDVDSETPTLIAGKVTGVVGASDDASYLYFVSEEDLDAGATAGEPNLYLRRGTDLIFIATIGADEANHGHNVIPSIVNQEPILRTSRVTPDGRHLAFMSDLSLTGYDNRDAKTGDPDDEVFRYDADAGQLACVSCNPSGARPAGRPLNIGGALKVLPISAKLPTWSTQLYAPNALSADGSRVFFSSYDALVKGDTNGAQDVYQWEEQGTGSCESAGGCIDLISTGESPNDSEFFDATANGDSVFFATYSSISAQDPGSKDVYVARVGGGFPPPPPGVAPCVGDACQNVPAPPSDPTPASASFNGPGNLAASKAKRKARKCRAHKPKTAKGKAQRKQAKSCKRAKRRAHR
jgi:hypothetical protein